MDINKVGDRGGNISYSKAGLRQAQVAGHYNEIQIQNNVFFSIDGVFGALAPVDNQAFAAGFGAISACNIAIFAVWVNNTNALAFTRGALVDPATLGGTGGQGTKALPMPDVVSNNSLVGLVKVKVGVGATFTPGTTNLNATNITATFFDCSTMPTLPALS